MEANNPGNRAKALFMRRAALCPEHSSQAARGRSAQSAALPGAGRTAAAPAYHMALQETHLLSRQSQPDPLPADS